MTARRRNFVIVIGLVALVLTVLPFVRDAEDRVIDEETRTALRAEGHRFASLPGGVVHYELAGPEDGSLVVLVHGVSGPMEVWAPMVRALNDAGWRTLRFDHYGRGWSDRVDVDYDLDLFASTIDGLLEHVGHTGQVHLLGSSMGAIVAAEWTQRHPERVAAVALLGPAGLPLDASPLATLIRVPGVGDWMMKVAGDGSLAAHNRRYFFDPTPFAAFQTRFEEQLRVVGSKAAVLSTMRHTPVQAYLPRYRTYAELRKPTLLVWGRDDPAFPYAHHPKVLEAIPHATLISVDRAGHLPMLEQPDDVLPSVVEFLRSAETIE